MADLTNPDGYIVMLEMGEWQFLMYPKSVEYEDEYIILSHKECPKGFCASWGGMNELDTPSVMHWKNHTCQRCDGTPPDGLFATYTLYGWGTGQEDL